MVVSKVSKVSMVVTGFFCAVFWESVCIKSLHTHTSFHALDAITYIHRYE